GSLTFGIPIDKPALYRLETTGVIETAGTLRTRIIPDLFSDRSGGVGRNFLIQQYIREGGFMLTVSAPGPSFGRIGLQLSETPLIDGGTLDAGVPARATLAPGQAIAYRFKVPEAGDYHIQTLGLGHGFTMRLDDGDGWPIVKPGGAAEATLRLAAGAYRMVVLPRSVESRAVTLLQPIEKPAERQGHGPFEVALGTELENRWLEPDVGAPRVPDRWHLKLPAPATVTVSIDSGMRAVVSADRVALTDAPWKGKLPAGDYEIQVTSAEPNNRVDYGLRVDAEELLAGLSEEITAPARIPVSIGGDHQVELTSFGSSDVRARLLDAGGHLAAANDDRDNDWNFLIAGRFAPGAYTLQVDPVGSETAQTSIAFAEPEEASDRTLTLDRATAIADGKVHLIPVPETRPGGLLLATAQGPAPFGLTLEAHGGDGAWQTVTEARGLDPWLAVPRGADSGGVYRIRAWSLDHGASPTQVTVTETDPASVNEAAARNGTTLGTVKIGGETFGVARVQLDRPGLIGFAEDEPSLRWASLPEHGLAGDPSGAAIARETALFLADRRPHPVKLRRLDPTAAPVKLALGPGDAVSLPLDAAEGKDHPSLWLAEAQGGQPGVTVAAAAEDAPPLMAIGGDGSATTRAVGFDPGGLPKPVLRLWQAGDPVDALPVTLTRTSLVPPRAMAAGLGATDASLGPHDCVKVTLPPGNKRLSLVLPEEVTAVLLKDGAPQRLIEGSGASADIIETTADTVLVANRAAAEAHFGLRMEPSIGGDMPALAPGGILTRYSPVPAILHLAASGGDTVPVHFAGSVTNLAAIAPDGRVTRDTAAMAAGGSLLDVAVRPGLAALELGAPSSAPESVQEIAPPGAVALAGTRMGLRIPAGPARLLHIETDAPVIVHGASAGLFAAGAVINLVLSDGRPAELDFEPAGGGTLSGSARFAATPPTPLNDGLGPKLRLAPGESRLFSFTLAEPRSVGVGVRASVDVATSRLIAAATGQEIGRGLVHMHSLAAGQYLLVVDVPPDSVAVDIQPAFVGTTVPDKGPPDSVKAQYLALTGGQAVR
ncbi:MAG TPA: hypothetical protein VKS60_06600, partial [Stellaceae bacterium]|nr:hypothetical protein [Stellaceae bacterium]